MKVYFNIMLLLFVLETTGQVTNIMIDESLTGSNPCEPSIAINTNNPAFLVAGAVLKRVYISSDTGRTWLSANLTSKLGVYGDPCIIYGGKNKFHYLHLSDPSGKGWADDRLLDRIVCQTSKNNGRKWSKGASIGEAHPKDQDKEWAVADPESGRVYCTWTQFDKYGSKESGDSSCILFSSGKPNGRNWTDPVRINQKAGDCLDSDHTAEGAVPCVGPSGEVYVSWAMGDVIWFDRSTDGGKSWLKNDISATAISGGWSQEIPGIFRANGQPVTLCDRSTGPHRNRIYIVWADQRFGIEDTDIWCVFSDNKGDLWSDPVRINDDLPGRHQFFPWAAIDQVNGLFYVVFYDRRNHPNTKTDVWLAKSSDGGLTFSNKQISEHPFTPNPYVFFGDYNNIVAHDGIIRPIWTASDGKKLSIWTALIND